MFFIHAAFLLNDGGGILKNQSESNVQEVLEQGKWVLQRAKSYTKYLKISILASPWRFQSFGTHLI